MDEGTLQLLGILIIVAAILNVILFFKIWIMTNDIRGLHKLTFLKETNEKESTDYSKRALEQTITSELSRTSEVPEVEKELEALWEEKKKK